MDTDAANNLLAIYVENGRRILGAGFGVNAAESSFFDAITLLRQHPELKPVFLSRAARSFEMVEPGLLAPGTVPMELIELVAHELNWPELQNMAASRVANRFHGNWLLAVSDLSDRVRRAQANDWSDREFYRHYKNQE
jgi:hypothetical protein